MSDSDLLFGDDDGDIPDVTENVRQKIKNWRILVVDDEEQVHKVTSLVLSNCEFDGASIELIHAYSFQEAKKVLAEQPPFALALIDVVMETDDAGLNLVQHIREELEDHDIRLVLRTGQPGQAPEETVITKYDINDYKNKTELTSTKLKTLLYSTLRSYRDILTISNNRQGLFNLVDAMSKIVDTDKLAKFASTVLEELGAILNLDADAVCAHVSLEAVAAQTEKQEYFILAATGDIKKLIEEKKGLPTEIIEYFDQAKNDRNSIHKEDAYIGYYNTPAAGENFLFVRPNKPLHDLGIHLLDMYTRCVAITHSNLHQKNAMQQSRQELVYVLSETIETRRPDKSNHVRRVSQMAYLLTQHLGLDRSICERIKLAAPLHDIGTVGIPDSTLKKNDIYTDEDKQTMRGHSEIGATILGNSKKSILQMASIIASQHHERWDGTGYPNGLKGEEIDFSARVVSITDSIDALGSHRNYRPAMTQDEVKAHLINESGKQFDPKLVENAVQLLDQFSEVRNEYPDGL